MANINAPAGLTPVDHLLGLNWTGSGRNYYIAASDGNAYAQGDPVVITLGASALGIPQITLATAGTSNQVTGVFMGGGLIEGGPYFDPTNLNTTVIAAGHTSAYYAYVIDDPFVIFEIQEASDSTVLTSASVGHNANLLSGTNNGYVSGWQMSEVSLASTSTLQLHTLGLARRSNNIFGASAKWLVTINNHTYRGGVTAV